MTSSAEQRERMKQFELDLKKIITGILAQTPELFIKEFKINFDMGTILIHIHTTRRPRPVFEIAFSFWDNRITYINIGLNEEFKQYLPLAEKLGEEIKKYTKHEREVEVDLTSFPYFNFRTSGGCLSGPRGDEVVGVEIVKFRMISVKIQQAARIFEKIQDRKKTALAMPQWQPGLLSDILDREQTVIEICKSGVQSIEGILRQEEVDAATKNSLLKILESIKPTIEVWEQEHLLWKKLNNVSDQTQISILKEQITVKQNQEISLIAGIQSEMQKYEKSLKGKLFYAELPAIITVGTLGIVVLIGMLGLISVAIYEFLVSKQ